MSGIVGSKLNHKGSGVVAKLGTDGQHLLSSGKGVTANYETVTAATYDDTDIRRDIITLALKEGITENRVAYNLPNAHVQQFQDDTGIGAETTGDRSSDEYWSPTTSSTLTPDGDDWEGNTGSYTLTSGGANCTTGDNAMTITTDFSGDVTATFDVDGGAANSQGYGYYKDRVEYCYGKMMVLLFILGHKLQLLPLLLLYVMTERAVLREIFNRYLSCIARSMQQEL
jgi:hypothetical protein